MIRGDSNIEKKSFFFVLVLAVVSAIFLFILYQKSNKTLPLAFIVIVVMGYFVFSLFHGYSVMGLRNILSLKIIVMGITYLGEFIGVNYGWIFGSYFYSDMLGLKLFGIPLIVIFVWDTYVYISYILVTNIVNARIKKHFSWIKKFAFSLSIALLTGLATTSIDLILDPIAVKMGWWVWKGGGNYFPNISAGVPAVNFIGWIFLSTLSIFIFKMFLEKPFVDKETIYEFAPFIPYFLMMVCFSFIGIVMKLYGPILVGSFAMSGFCLFFIITYFKRKNNMPKVKNNK